MENDKEQSERKPVETNTGMEYFERMEDFERSNEINTSLWTQGKKKDQKWKQEIKKDHS